MAANVVTKVYSYSGDQAGAFVDSITFTASGTRLIVENRSSTVHISLTWGSSAAPAAPTYLGDDTLYVPAGAFRAYPLEQVVKYVKLIGSTTAMSYTVSVI